MYGDFRDVSLTARRSAVDKHSLCSSIHSVVDNLDATKVSVSIREFLHRLQYIPPNIPANPELRREVADVIASWNIGVDWEYIEGLTETGCSMAESPYPHLSYEHQRLVAIYTACVAYMDDQAHPILEALGQFGRRFTRGEPQLHPALDCLTQLLRTLHDFFPHISADAIIVSTLDAAMAMCIEVVSQNKAVSPFATKYPFYLRLKAGIAPAYAHFNFPKSVGDTVGTSYLQVIPELEFMSVGFNDILSFYKEIQAGETDNYVHVRASAEHKPVAVIFSEIMEENIQSWYNVKQIASGHSDLADICVGHIMGYIEFHFKARRRYRLHEIMKQS